MAPKATHPYQRGEPVGSPTWLPIVAVAPPCTFNYLLFSSTTKLRRFRRQQRHAASLLPISPPNRDDSHHSSVFCPGAVRASWSSRVLRNIRVRFSLCVFKPTACSLAPTSNAHAPRSSGGVAGPSPDRRGSLRVPRGCYATPQRRRRHTAQRPPPAERAPRSRAATSKRSSVPPSRKASRPFASASFTITPSPAS
jgi:hypothetical protein